MVQRPFSEMNSPQQKWINKTSQHSLRENEAFNFPGITQAKTVFLHNLQRHKLSTTSTSKKNNNIVTHQHLNKPNMANELEMNIINTSNHTYRPTMQSPTELPQNISNVKLAIKNYYQIPAPSRFFPPIEEHDAQNVAQSFEQRGNSKENTVVIPSFQDALKEKESLQVKGIIVPKSKLKTDNETTIVNRDTMHSIIDIDPDNDKADFLIEGLPMDSTMFSYNLTSDPYTCSVIHSASADIDAQERFSQFNIEVRTVAAIVGIKCGKVRIKLTLVNFAALLDT